MPKPQLVTYDEISEMSGGQLKAASLRMSAHRGELPERAHLRFPIWEEKDIVKWLRAKGIAPQEISTPRNEQDIARDRENLDRFLAKRSK